MLDVRGSELLGTGVRLDLLNQGVQEELRRMLDPALDVVVGLDVLSLANRIRHSKNWQAECYRAVGVNILTARYTLAAVMRFDDYSRWGGKEFDGVRERLEQLASHRLPEVYEQEDYIGTTPITSDDWTQMRTQAKPMAITSTPILPFGEQSPLILSA